MNRIDFSLNPSPTAPMAELPVGSELMLWVANYSVDAARGKKVVRGTRIATHKEPAGGLLCAPCAGKVADVDVGYVRMTVADQGEAGESVEPISVASYSGGDSLRDTLADMGIDTRPLLPANMLIINGLNPEPGVSVCSQLYADCRQTLEAGLRIARRVVAPSSCVYASPDSGQTLDDCRTVAVQPVYPNSLPALVTRQATGQKAPGSVTVLGLKELYSIGRVAETGLPLDRTVMTVNDANYIVPLGMPVRELLKAADLPYGPGDRIVLGGPMRGRAIYNLENGVGRRHYGLFVIPRDRFPRVVDTPCINCGECVLHCPARLRPNEIARYAEYDQFAKAERSGLAGCLECGLCAFYCTANRPLMHYLRFAKQQLRELAQTTRAQ